MLNKYRIQLLEKPTVVLFSSKCNQNLVAFRALGVLISQK